MTLGLANVLFICKYGREEASQKQGFWEIKQVRRAQAKR
jgi:hypothetical protein